MQKLPYRATTRSGELFDLEFPLHSETADAVRVGQLLSEILGVIDKELDFAGEMSNGDVLQAIAMAMAVRSRMIAAPPETTRKLSAELLQNAFSAAAAAEHHAPPAGHA